PGHERPDQIGGDRDRPSHDKAGQKIIPDAARDRRMDDRLLGHGRRNGRQLGRGHLHQTARETLTRAGNMGWRRREPGAGRPSLTYSTVTDFARLRGWSISVP